MKHLTDPMPTIPEAVNYVPEPGDKTMLMLGVLEKRGGPRSVVVSLHPVTTTGRIACDCKFKPEQVEFYDLDGVRGDTRKALCEEGMTRLRAFVRREKREKAAR